MAEASELILHNLCKYYIECIALEEKTDVVVFQSSKYGLKYLEGEYADKRIFETPLAANFLREERKSQPQTFYLGYPNLIAKRYSAKTNEAFYLVIPVFLYQVEYDNNALAPVPSINLEIIKRYAHSPTEQLRELLELENLLGLNSSDADVDIKVLAPKLQEARKWQWEWNEEINPEKIDTSIPLSKLCEEGIYNRAAIFSCDAPKYTHGLVDELFALSQMKESDYEGTALYDWIHKENLDKEKEIPSATIDVLPLNMEQQLAVQKALDANLAIITGPPGTGKSQVVTNLLLNIAWNGKNALLASKTHKAVDVVELRVNGLCDKPILLRTGSGSYFQYLAEQIDSFLSSYANEDDLKEYSSCKDEYEKLSNEYHILKAQKSDLVTLRNKVDTTERKYCTIRDEFKNCYSIINDQLVAEIRHLICNLQDAHQKLDKKPQNILHRIFWPIVKKIYQKRYEAHQSKLQAKLTEFGITVPFCFSELDNLMDSFIITLQYKNLLSDLVEAESLESLDKKLYDKKRELAELTPDLWHKWLNTRALDLSSNQRSQMSQYVATLKLSENKNLDSHPKKKKEFAKIQNEMTRYLPCWAVTTLSAKGRIPFQAGFFDLLVIDEASQCDIASILPLLYRAKRAVVIGDPQQLSHITSISQQHDLKLLEKYNISPEWSYSANSLYAIANGIAAPNNIVHLKDHHRCHADIIEFSNREFYASNLRIATDYRKLVKGVDLGIQWNNVVGKTVRPSNGSAYNIAEVNAIIDELQRLVEVKYKGTIGIVTPFAAQVKMINDRINKMEGLNEALQKNDFLVDTVHRFQGDEKDLIIFSSVISENTQKGTIDFLKGNGNLFNVAITRARSTLKVVGDMNYCLECDVSYMKDFARYVFELQSKINNVESEIDYPHSENYPDVPNKEQVSDWEVMLYQKLYKAGIETIPQYPVEKYHLDLAIVLGSKKLDIEVDGEKYHKNWNGELCYRDQLRNQRLIELGWDVKRFWVYQLRDDLPNCIKQIKKWIEKNKL